MFTVRQSLGWKTNMGSSQLWKPNPLVLICVEARHSDRYCSSCITQLVTTSVCILQVGWIDITRHSRIFSIHYRNNMRPATISHVGVAVGSMKG